MQVVDLDVFVYEPLEITLEGKKFIINKIPMIVSVQIYDLVPVLEELEKQSALNRENYEKIFNLLYDIFKISDPNLDREWLLNEIDMPRFNELIGIVISKIFGASKKNSSEEALTGST